ncbi:unnamed protein product [Didymodactylos carnosus]|uniref:Phage tail collar domain-containing protein n=1 Tax=Didymodactylos carnosus TaxID=1234261 RepID=A0A8S2HCC7_9BILA|nr:unnamed protein product [Didymodactylos carnosus]CAF3628265.1 unnamed protein product [Didymodactylos carnosus]
MAVRMAVFHRNTGQYPQSTGIRYPPAQYGSPERQLFAPQVPAPQSTTAELTAPIDATDAWAPPTNEERFHGTTWQEPRNMTSDSTSFCSQSCKNCLFGLLCGLLLCGIGLAVVLTLWLTNNDGLPVGTVMLYTGTSVPSKWLRCDGSAISRSTYSQLYSVIGTLYGTGDGVDTFNLPDFRGRFPLGLNSTAQEVAGINQSGSRTHVLTVSEMPAHNHGTGTLVTLTDGNHSHSITDPGHNHGGSTGTAAFGSGSLSMDYSETGTGSISETHSHTISSSTTNIVINAGGSHTHTISGSTATNGSSQAMSLMPPYQTVDYIILTQQLKIYN